MLKEKQGVRGEWEWVIEQTGRKTAIENCFSCCKVGPFLEFDSLAFTVSQSSHQRVFFWGGGIILINLSVSLSHFSSSHFISFHSDGLSGAAVHRHASSGKRLEL